MGRDGEETFGDGMETEKHCGTGTVEMLVYKLETCTPVCAFVCVCVVLG